MSMTDDSTAVAQTAEVPQQEGTFLAPLPLVRRSLGKPNSVPADGFGQEGRWERLLIDGRALTRMFRSEIGLHVVRGRNWAGVGVLVSVPIIVAVCMKVASDEAASSGGPVFLSSVTDNGLFVALASIAMEISLFFPLAVSTISADSIAGEAGSGTLRSLVTVPVPRTRLLIIKYLAVLVGFAGALLLVAVTGVLVGVALFGAGPLTTLSGVQISFTAALWRLTLVCLYLELCFAAFAAIGLFISTLTEQPVPAVIATVTVGMVSQILDTIPQLKAIHEYLPTHYWMAHVDLMRDPITTMSINPGILSALAYIAIFLSAAWARFTDMDITC